MTIFLDERLGSPRLVAGSNPSREFLYNATYDDGETEQDVEAFVLANTPTGVDGLPRGPVIVEADDELGDELYRVEVRYQRLTGGAPPAESGGPQGKRTRIGFNTQRIKRSVQTVTTVGDAPDFGGQIGVSQNGVEGVDVVIPTFRFERFQRVAEAAYTNTFENLLLSVVGSVNSAAFQGKAIGTVLLEGAETVYIPDDEEYEIRYEFSGRLNETGVVVGDLAPVDVQGWDYLWVLYEDKEDPTTKRVIKKAVAAYVERIYPRADFNILGIT